MKQKAQLAMESILIYGFIILVVMLAASGLVYFGVFDLSKYLPDRCEFDGVPLFCGEYAIIKSAEEPIEGYKSLAVFELKNNLGKSINLTYFYITGQEQAAGFWNCGPVEPFSLVNSGATKLLRIGCDVQADVNTKLDGMIRLNYYIIGSTIKKAATGKIKTTVQ